MADEGRDIHAGFASYIARTFPEALDALGQSIVAAIQSNIDEAYPPASKPGHPPHRRTGELRAGIVYAVDAPRMQLIVESTAPYSNYLEFGTPNTARRPFMQPAFERYQPLAARLVADEMRRRTKS